MQLFRPPRLAQLIVGLIIMAGCALGVILFWILNAG